MQARTIRLKAKLMVSKDTHTRHYEVGHPGEVFLGDNLDLYWKPDDGDENVPIWYAQVNLTEMHPMIIWAAHWALQHGRIATRNHFDSNWVELDFVKAMLGQLLKEGGDAENKTE